MIRECKEIVKKSKHSIQVPRTSGKTRRIPNFPEAPTFGKIGKNVGRFTRYRREIK